MKLLDEMSLEEQVGCFKEFDALPEKVKLLIWEDMKNSYSGFLGDGILRFILSVASNAYSIKKCESPIEQMLCIAMDIRFRGGVGFCAGAESQAQIEVGGNKYRVDFLVQVIYDACSPKEYESYIVIECDGHDFHEKTKLQAQKDKQRDRNLQIAGYPVLRFTGSEIYRDPFKCVEDIENYILTSKKVTT